MEASVENRKPGVLIISHGSRDKQWVHLVENAVDQMELSRNVPVECSFLELVEGKLIQDGIDRLEAQGVTDLITVPLFVASGSTHIDEISWALGVKEEPVLETDLERFRLSSRVHFCEPMDDDPLVVEMMYDKIKALSAQPEQEIVLILAHGSIEKGFHLTWRRMLESLAAQLKARGGFDETDVAMLLPDQTDRKMKWWRKHKPEHSVIVAPLFLSAGYFTNKVIPDRMKAYDYRYNGHALLPHPLVKTWLEKRVEDKLHELFSG
ncbi:sirohydrochlorin chelatase [Marinicrinis sediminis]|uniref:Sirohydrochlorin chelatase n=1 Tax=Marinicrinis sediminis TaxID=1652465 RepID=A0ABW5RA75_9BACL